MQSQVAWLGDAGGNSISVSSTNIECHDSWVNHLHYFPNPKKNGFNQNVQWMPFGGFYGINLKNKLIFPRSRVMFWCVGGHMYHISFNITPHSPLAFSITPIQISLEHSIQRFNHHLVLYNKIRVENSRSCLNFKTISRMPRLAYPEFCSRIDVLILVECLQALAKRYYYFFSDWHNKHYGKYASAKHRRVDKLTFNTLRINESVQ